MRTTAGSIEIRKASVDKDEQKPLALTTKRVGVTLRLQRVNSQTHLNPREPRRPQFANPPLQVPITEAWVPSGLTCTIVEHNSSKPFVKLLGQRCDRRRREDVTRLSPERRNIAMVFQSYALWPHMTVAQNIGYGLKLRHVVAARLRRRHHQHCPDSAYRSAGHPQVIFVEDDHAQRVHPPRRQ